MGRLISDTDSYLTICKYEVNHVDQCVQINCDSRIPHLIYMYMLCIETTLINPKLLYYHNTMLKKLNKRIQIHIEFLMAHSIKLPIQHLIKHHLMVLFTTYPWPSRNFTTYPGPEHEEDDNHVLTLKYNSSNDNSLQGVELSGLQTCKLLSTHPSKPFPRRFSGPESVCSG